MQQRLSCARAHALRVLVPGGPDDGDERADDDAEQYRRECDFQRVSQTGHKVFPPVVFYEVEDKFCLDLRVPVHPRSGTSFPAGRRARKPTSFLRSAGTYSGQFAEMYLSTMVFTVPSAISSSSAWLKASVSSLPFAKADGVIFDRVGGLQNLQILICCDEGLCRLVVNDDAVQLAGDERCHSVCTLVEALHMIVAKVIRAVDIARGVLLDADLIIRAVGVEIVRPWRSGSLP